MRVYDVTLPLSARLPSWPDDPAFSRQVVSSHAAGDEVEVSAIGLGSHTGTHIDAPRHLFPNGRTIDQLPFDSLMGEAWVCRLNPGLTAVTAQALESAEIPKEVRRLLLATGNGLLWNGNDWSFSSQFVALSKDAAEWVVARGINLLGIDYLSVDTFDSPGLPAHRTLLSHDVVVVEGLDMRDVPAGPYRLCCLPLRLEGADGAPARVVLIDTS